MFDFDPNKVVIDEIVNKNGSGVKKKKFSSKAIIAIAVVAAIVVVVVIIGILFVVRKRLRKRVENKLEIVNFDDIENNAGL